MRKTYFWHFEDGIYVRAGCFFGALAQFREAVKARHAQTVAGETYQMFADIACKTFGESFHSR